MKSNYLLKPESVQQDMQAIASDLMNNWVLRVKDNEYRLCEIEFYYRQKKNNNPEQSKVQVEGYLHGNQLQEEYGRWYFHGSGVDITIGTPDYSASILIRAICNNSDPKGYIYGPLNVINKLFSSFGPTDLHEIPFGLDPAQANSLEFEEPIAARRVGLNKDKDPNMFDALYRFLIMRKSKHADKAGIAKAMTDSGMNPDDKKTGIWG